MKLFFTIVIIAGIILVIADVIIGARTQDITKHNFKLAGLGLLILGGGIVGLMFSL
jgi:hypothetical protein